MRRATKVFSAYDTVTAHKNSVHVAMFKSYMRLGLWVFYLGKRRGKTTELCHSGRIFDELSTGELGFSINKLPSRLQQKIQIKFG